MATDVIMPQMGADMTEGTVVRWLKQVGDDVKRGDIIAEIETDKATVELEAFGSGILKKLVVNEGETVPVGQVIAIIGEAGEAVEGEPERKAPTPVASRKAEPAAEPAPPGSGQGEPRAAAAPASDGAGPSPSREPAGAATGEGRLRISPVARRIAQEAGVELASVTGSGPDGRILRRDVEAAARAAKAAPRAAASSDMPPAPAQANTAPAVPQQAKAAPEGDQRQTAAATARPPETRSPAAPEPRRAPPAGDEGTVPLSRMRQAIARRMAQSKQAAPHYYLTLDIDMTDAMTFRGQLNAAASEEQRVTVNDLVVKACALAIPRHPKFNAEFSEQGLVMHPEINVCIGVALDEGLIAPAILDCGEKSLGRIAEEAKDLIARAKGGRLRPEEYSGGTFTITNLGAYGVETLIGIINPPQAAILGVGSVMEQPAVRDGQVVVRQLMKVALSADHRVTDGAEGARFIKEIQGFLENPVRLAL